MRLDFDYRKLNQITVTDPEPLTTAEDLFQKLGQCQRLLADTSGR